MHALDKALPAALAMAGIIILCRALPFLFFSKKAPPTALTFVEKYMPALAMTVLAVSSFTALPWADSPEGILKLVAGAVVIALHVWKRNILLSILGGTALYMLLAARFLA